MRRGNLAYALLCGTLATLLACVSSCNSDNPTTVVDHPSVIDPEGNRDFFIMSVALDGAPEVQVDAWGYNLTVEADTLVSFDLVIVNRSDRIIYRPAQVQVVDIKPDAVKVLNPDNLVPATLPIFYLNDHMGDDNQLDPGESTSGVHILFGMPRLMSFSLGLRIAGFVPGPESVSGTMFDDVVKDGVFDPTLEVGLSRQNLAIYSAPDSGGTARIVKLATTDATGRYVFHDLAAGVYSLEARGPIGWESTTPNPRLVTLVEGADGKVRPVTGVDFGFFNPGPSDSSLLYHVHVSATDHQRDDMFVNPPSSANHCYVLGVTEPIYIRAPVGAIYGSQVWINGTSVWEVDCSSPRPAYDCNPGSGRIGFRIELPAGLVTLGRNDIRIVVDGWGEPFWIYTIWRLPTVPEAAR